MAHVHARPVNNICLLTIPFHNAKQVWQAISLLIKHHQHYHSVICTQINLDCQEWDAAIADMTAALVLLPGIYATATVVNQQPCGLQGLHNLPVALPEKKLGLKLKLPKQFCYCCRCCFIALQQRLGTFCNGGGKFGSAGEVCTQILIRHQAMSPGCPEDLPSIFN